MGCAACGKRYTPSNSNSAVQEVGPRYNITPNAPQPEQTQPSQNLGNNQPVVAEEEKKDK